MNGDDIGANITVPRSGVQRKLFDDEALNGQNEKFLALALETTSDGIWVWHIPSGEAYFSPNYYRMLGYEPGEFPATYATWTRLLHPDDLEKTQAFIQRHIEDESEGYDVEFRLRTKSGKWLWILGRGNIVEWDDDGQAIRIVGSHVNIDTRKRTEQKLAQYKAQLENMVRERTLALEQTTALLEATFNSIPDVLGVQDNQHRIIRYNSSGYRFLNKTHEEVAGKKCFELIGRDKECDLCATSECYRTKKPASIERYEESLDAWLDVRAYPILDENGSLVKVIEHLRDITPAKKAEAENRKLHEQLAHVQKMESLGTLAGGIAHDFNNLLMGVQGYISLMSLDLDPGDPHQKHIEAIGKYIRSATDLTRQLLGFARGGKYEVKPIDLNRLVLDSAAMFSRTRKELKIYIKTLPDPLSVEVDRRQIEQVLLNLYINAWQAMPDGGALYLETRVVALGDAYRELYQAKPGCYAMVSVTDTGIGMDASVCKRIFDPFFTTKEKERGTGLGLASAYGIVKNHAGLITVYSETGQGTTFNVYLPISDKAVCQGVLVEKSLSKGWETILLVDDERMILEVAKAMLEKLGYQVIAARGGEEAIGAIKEMKSDLDLVILDLIMPGLDGGKVFDCIRSIRPELPVILASGYAVSGQAEALMRKGCNGFIQKPFDIHELSENVRKVLDGATS